MPPRTAVATVSVLVLLGACTWIAVDAAAPPGPTRTVTEQPPARTTPPEPVVVPAEVALPAEATTVVAGDDAATASLSVSRALYAAAPVAVVAPADDVDAQLLAASAAVALGAPVLVDADRAVGDDATADELERLGARVVVTTGGVAVTTGTPFVEAPADPAALATTVRDLVLDAVPPAAQPVDVAAGGEVAAVAALDPAAPVLLRVPGAAGAPGTPPADDAPTAPPTEPAADDDASAPPSAAPSAPPTDRDAHLARPEPAPAGSVLLTTGAATDVAAVATARAAGLGVVVVPGGDPRATSATVRAVAAAAPSRVVAVGGAFGTAEDIAWRVATAATGVELPGGGQVLFPGRRLVALYGTPTTSALGLLGEQDLPATVARVQGLAAEYQALTSDTVVPAFEIIVTVASSGAGPDGNYSNELPVESFVPWVETARDAGIYVVIDLQPGRTDFLTQAKQYEPLLRHPNVGLALDPEWRLAPDQVHLRQIGSVGVDEVNAVVDWLAHLTRENALPQKLLVLHQFQLRMIDGRERLDTTRPELAVMIHADGQGSQPAKAGTWAALRAGAPPGVTWGWKNFVDEDVPMLTPAQTYGVQPLPELVTYQ
ncbi:hypothetical protein Q9R32_12330 [Actinotalea sp. AC32]|nr:hypothetical protein [Actinotalea sp. AC32]